jgi:hypothetical protein
VLAILITIMAFQLVPPDGGHLADLRDVVPDVLAFALSFVFLGIYWNNHHHLFRATEHIDAAVMWANLALLFALTLIPGTTTWLAAHHEDSGPAVLYGLIGLAAGMAYFIRGGAHRPRSQRRDLGGAVRDGGRPGVREPLHRHRDVCGRVDHVDRPRPASGRRVIVGVTRA